MIESIITGMLAGGGLQALSPETGQVEPPAKRYAYPYTKLDDFDIYVYAGEPVEIEDELPPNSLQWVPQDAYGNTKIYFDGFGWYLGPDLEKSDLANVQRAVEMRLTNDFNKAVDALIAGYGAAEMKSWSQQAAEANSVVAGGGEPTAPLLTALAKARGTTLKELAATVKAKADAYAAGYAQALADYQVKRDEVSQAKSVKDLSKLITIEDVKHLPFFA